MPFGIREYSGSCAGRPARRRGGGSHGERAAGEGRWWSPYLGRRRQRVHYHLWDELRLLIE